MSQHETATPQARISITPATTPAPPWTGVKFTCQNPACPAEYQLEAADHCNEIELLPNHVMRIELPACWDCGFVSTIKIPSEESESSAVEILEGRS